MTKVSSGERAIELGLMAVVNLLAQSKAYFRGSVSHFDTMYFEPPRLSLLAKRILSTESTNTFNGNSTVETGLNSILKEGAIVVMWSH
jgi:hypothetical protein